MHPFGELVARQRLGHSAGSWLEDDKFLCGSLERGKRSPNVDDIIPAVGVGGRGIPRQECRRKARDQIASLTIGGLGGDSNRHLGGVRRFGRVGRSRG